MLWQAWPLESRDGEITATVGRALGAPALSCLCFLQASLCALCEKLLPVCDGPWLFFSVHAPCEQKCF